MIMNRKFSSTDGNCSNKTKSIQFPPIKLVLVTQKPSNEYTRQIQLSYVSEQWLYTMRYDKVFTDKPNH